MRSFYKNLDIRSTKKSHDSCIARWVERRERTVTWSAFRYMCNDVIWYFWFQWRQFFFIPCAKHCATVLRLYHPPHVIHCMGTSFGHSSHRQKEPASLWDNLISKFQCHRLTIRCQTWKNFYWETKNKLLQTIFALKMFSWEINIC